jgi:Spy/CpxP family protein refolding chaperone
VNTWKVILATLVIFIAGAITGGLVVSQSRSRDTMPPASVRPAPQNTAGTGTNGVRHIRLPAPRPGPLRKDFVDHLQRELDITADQRERIEKIISEGQEQTKELWEHVEPEIFSTIVETKNRIRGELTPEQKEKFEELLKQRYRPQHRTHGTNAPPAEPK